MKRAWFAVFLIAGIAGWSEDPPAPSTDRVGFPEGYKDKYAVARTSEVPEKGEVKVIYANPAAASAKGGPYPYGSVIVMETRKSGTVTGLHVMRKERGFGEAYQQNRTGEWEYTEYRPDRSYITTPQKSFACAGCHLKAGAGKDFVYGGPAGR